MFGLAAGIYETYLSAPEANILIIGDESAGKTALMERLKVMKFKRPSTQQQNGRGFKVQNKKKMLPLHKIKPTSE